MTREERELLRQDLCARAPYGVIVKVIKYGKCYDEREKNKTVDCKIVGINRYTLITDKDNVEHTYAKGYVSTPITVPIDDGDTKSLPYLRPMSSMTEEELIELNCICYHNISIQDDMLCGYICCGELEDVFDYLNSIHVDYRGLISKGLALEAPEDMYNFN